MDPPIALPAYEELAEAYASIIDTKPHNAYYERPATLSLLPDVQGLFVLDAGCGPGVDSDWLASRGAVVTALDASPKMVELAVKVPSFRRSLQETLNPFFEVGYRVDKIVEPEPTADFQMAGPRHYDELMRFPAFLCIRAVKPSAI